MTGPDATYDAEVNTVAARIQGVSVPVRPGMHRPVKLEGADGAPARVLLRRPVAEPS